MGNICWRSVYEHIACISPLHSNSRQKYAVLCVFVCMLLVMETMHPFVYIYSAFHMCCCFGGVVGMCRVVGVVMSEMLSNKSR